VNIEARFVTTATGASDFPRDGLAEIALVGRSNVGKSSLINALARQRVARTSAAPGKTRLANVYRMARGNARPFHLVDLPGYGYARGQSAQGTAQPEPAFDDLVRAVFARTPAALLLVDVRHPGLESDRAAWEWVSSAAAGAAVVATKIDKLARGERIRAMRQHESVFDASVLPVSAVTGEGLDELWNLIDSLVNRRNRNSRPSRNSPRPPKPTARPREQPPTEPTRQPLRQKK
jgi:GTP-binding protein